MLSGEPNMVRKQQGDPVSAGTLNVDAPLIVVVRYTANNTKLARMIHLVEAAQASKAPVQKLADRIVPWFVAMTLGLAALTFVYWLPYDINTALLAAFAVLIITCPCALGLATPMAIAVSSGVGAKAGVLVRNGDALERLSGVDHVVFDKTGTLTHGRMRVVQVDSLSQAIGKQQVLQLAASVERNFPHPLARAICHEAESQGCACLPTLEHAMIPGMGVEAQWAGRKLYLGNARLMRQRGVILSVELQSREQGIEDSMGICVWLAMDAELIGLIHVQDSLRDGAIEVIAALRQAGMGLTMLTGDSARAAAYVRQQLGEMDVVAEVLPEKKAQLVRQLRESGKTVLMVGDGVNDAPALALADVAIAMGSGSDASMETSDVVLMSSDIRHVLYAVNLGRQTLKTIRQNLMLSLAYNVLLVPVAMAALITPVFAAIAMPLSSLMVIGNAMLIRRRMKGSK